MLPTPAQRRTGFALQLVLGILFFPGLPLLLNADRGCAAAWFLFQCMCFVVSHSLLWRKNPDLFRERSHSVDFTWSSKVLVPGTVILAAGYLIGI